LESNRGPAPPPPLHTSTYLGTIRRQKGGGTRRQKPTRREGGGRRTKEASQDGPQFQGLGSAAGAHLWTSILWMPSSWSFANGRRCCAASQRTRLHRCIWIVYAADANVSKTAEAVAVVRSRPLPALSAAVPLAFRLRPAIEPSRASDWTCRPRPAFFGRQLLGRPCARLPASRSLEPCRSTEPARLRARHSDEPSHPSHPSHPSSIHPARRRLQPSTHPPGSCMPASQHTYLPAYLSTQLMYEGYIQSYTHTSFLPLPAACLPACLPIYIHTHMQT